MPLVRPDPPSAETWEAYRRGMDELRELNRVPAGLLPGEDPQQIYILDAKDVVKGVGPGESIPVYWQFLVGASSGPVVACDVPQPPPGTTPRMTSLSRGPLNNKLIQATQTLQNLAEVREHNYELRRLKIGGLALWTFWLKSLAGGADLVVPYHSQYRGVTEMQVYTMEEFLAIVVTMAKKHLKKAAVVSATPPAGRSAKK
jgi:hypothetical protein